MGMELASVRLPLYVALVSVICCTATGYPDNLLNRFAVQWFCSFLVFCFTIARLSYTTHLPKGDTINGGIDFYGTSGVSAYEPI